MVMRSAFAHLSDEELLASLKRLVADERSKTVDVLRHIAEVDRRKAQVPTRYPSLFLYCVKELKFSEDQAYRRIHAARAARDHPVIFSMIDRGEISVATVSRLAPHFCRENYSVLLNQCAGKSLREVERVISSLDPSLEPPDRIEHLSTRAATRREAASPGEVSPQRELPEPRPAAPLPGSDRGAPLARRVRLKFTADETLLAKIQRVKKLLLPKHPSGRLEFLVDEAMEALLEKRDPERRLLRLAKRRRAATHSS